MKRQTKQGPVKPDIPPAAEPDLDTLLTVMRLLVGGTMEGVDELLRRLKERQQEVNRSQAANLTIFPLDSADPERLRHALIGLMFETPQVMARGVSKVRTNTQRATQTVAKVTKPVTNSWLARPFRRQIEKVVARGEAFVDRLAETGRMEEENGRLLAKATTNEALDEILAYLAEKPEIRQLVQQQGLSLTEEVVNALRKRTAEADRLVDRIIRRRNRDAPPIVDAPAVALPDGDEPPRS